MAKYKSEDEEYRRCKKVNQTAYQEYTYHMWQKLYRKNRDKHMSIHPDKLKNECPKCKKYRWDSSLSKHMSVKHPAAPHPTPERSPSLEF